MIAHGQRVVGRVLIKQAVEGFLFNGFRQPFGRLRRFEVVRRIVCQQRLRHQIIAVLPPHGKLARHAARVGILLGKLFQGGHEMAALRRFAVALLRQQLHELR